MKLFKVCRNNAGADNPAPYKALIETYEDGKHIDAHLINTLEQLLDITDTPVESYRDKMNLLKIQLESISLTLEIANYKEDSSDLIHPVSSQVVLDLLASKNITIEKKQLQLPLIEEFGLYRFNVQLDDDIQAAVKLWVVPSP
jgi:ribosomal protein L9